MLFKWLIPYKIFLSAFCCICVFSQGLMAEDKISVSIPINKETPGTVMQLIASQRLVTLGKRIQKAFNGDLAWAKTHIDAVKPGQPIAYDPKLGITYEEYQEFLKLSSNGFRLQEEFKVKLYFKKLPQGDVQISTYPETPIHGLKMSPEFISTPYGDLKDKSAVDMTAIESPPGPWKGIMWKSEDVNEEKNSGKSVRFHLGRLEKNGLGMIYYVVKLIRQPNIKDINTSFIIIFELPKDPTAAKTSPPSLTK